MNLNDDEKLSVATGLVLLKDWLQQNATPAERTKEAIYVIKLAQKLGIGEQLSEVTRSLPPMKITER